MAYLLGILAKAEKSESLFHFCCSNRGDAVFNAIVMILASILLFEGLGAFIDRVADLDFGGIGGAHD